MNLKSTLNKSVTLLELLISIGLLGFLVLIFTSIDSFSHFHVISADRRSKVQNEVSILLEHISKEANKAVGNLAVIPSQDPITITDIGVDKAIRIYVDSGPTGLDGIYLPGDGRWDLTNDRTVAYRFKGNPEYQVWFYPEYTADTDPHEVVAHNIMPSYTLIYDNTTTDGTPANNYFDITVTGRWEASQAASVDNPEVVMRTLIIMPSLSTR